MRKYIFSLIIALSSLSAMFAATVTETFEDVTVTDANSWNIGTSLSNGWKVMNGQISSVYFDSYNYALWNKGYESSHSITSQYGSSNSAYLLLPDKQSGTISFYANRTSSTKNGSITFYSITEVVGEEGTTYEKTLIEKFTLTEKEWVSLSLTLSEPCYLGIEIILGALDNLVYTGATTGGGGGEEEKHVHDYATAWSHDAEGHWHECLSETGICDAKQADYSKHDGAICSVCGYKTPGVETFPWSENFNSTNVTYPIPNMWENMGEGWSTTYGSVEGTGLGRCARFDSYRTEAEEGGALVTPWLYLPSEGDFSLILNYKNPNGGDFTIRLKEGNNWHPLRSGLTGIEEWTKDTISLAAYKGMAVKIYFVGTSNHEIGDAYIYVDDIVVKQVVAHAHEYAETWSYDREYHWHACLSEIGECSAAKKDWEAHSFDENDVCTICGYSRPWQVDFTELSTMPIDWTTDGWTVEKINGTSVASSRGTSERTLETPVLLAEKDDTLEIVTYLMYTDEPLVISYSTDRGENWIEIASLVSVEDHYLDGETIIEKFAAPEKGEYQLRFYGKSVYIQRLTGFKAKEKVVTTLRDAQSVPAQTGTYDLMGRKVATMLSGGIYIDNGKLKIIY